ncbi:MAG: helix-hairpin-helix domain-containing protein, partial [Nitrosospira sp.]|nr:helix-hairpin-helix domain-containing protein [Nitrosospira sp.]
MKKLLLLIVTLFALATAVHAGVNINTATQAELETLQGIGPGKAKAIINYRNKNGLFKSVDDLEKVEGIGPGIIKQLRQDAMVSGAGTVSKQDKPAAKPEDKSGKKEDKPAAKQEKKPVAK